MKRVFLLLVFLFVSFNAFGQVYHPLLVPGNYWDCYWGNSATVCGRQSGERLYVDGDTLINGLQYTRISSCTILSQYGSTVYCPPYYIDPTSCGQLKAFLREDSVARKVYRLGGANNLVYDFNLQIGDILDSCFNSGYPTIVGIHQTTNIYGDSVRQITFNQGSWTYSYTESVGSDYGLLGGFCIGLSEGGILGCYGNFFKTPNLNCAGTLGIESLNPDDYFVVLLNPNSGNLDVQNNRALPADVFVVDVLGRAEAIQHLGANETASLKVYSDAAVHVLKIVYTDGKVVTSKTW